MVPKFSETADLINIFSCLFFSTGKVYKFVDSKWREVSVEDQLTLTKTEGQVKKRNYCIISAFD
jgi:hypothetical protein